MWGELGEGVMGERGRRLRAAGAVLATAAADSDRQERRMRPGAPTMLPAAAALLCVVAGMCASAGSATTPGIEGCAPQCLQPNLTRPGNLPAGKYRTKYFFAGEMTLTFPKGWASGEDSTGEFAAWSKANPDSRIVFWEDVYAVTSRTPGSWQRVGPLRQTTAGLLSWLRKNPNLATSRPAAGTIGVVPARVTDIAVSKSALNDDPQCPAKPCANFVQFPQWDAPYGIAGKGVSRFYFSDVRYGGQKHLFAAVIEAVNKAQLSAFLPTAKTIIATVRVPAT